MKEIILATRAVDLLSNMVCNDNLTDHRAGEMGSRISTLGPPEQMADILKTAIPNTFSRYKISEFQIKFHWNVFYKGLLMVSHHLFRYWLGA